MIPNPYLIGGVALVIAILAGSTGTLYFKAKESDTRAGIAQAETKRLADELTDLHTRLSSVSTLLQSRDKTLADLRADYENRTTIVRRAADPTACADTALPDDIARVFAVPNASGNGDD